jgi:hypothetical protein
MVALVMRTTIDIPDAMYRRLKAQAATDGTSVKALILRGAEQALAPQSRRPSSRVALPLVRSKRPGRLQVDHARVYDVISFP